jgi:large subunit ribosomal protein L28
MLFKSRKSTYFAVQFFREKDMSKVCQLTGKRVITGNNVSHSKRRTRRTFEPNLFTRRFFNPDTNSYVTLKVSASAIRNITKNGLTACIKEAKAKGFM